MPPAVFEPAILAIERLQAYALDRTASMLDIILKKSPVAVLGFGFYRQRAVLKFV
jgi:hypothetical protein